MMPVAGAQHDLQLGIEMRDGLQQVVQPLLPGHPADEQDEGAVGVDAKLGNGVGILDRMVFLGIDAVGDHHHPGRLHVEQTQHVVAGAARDGDDGIGGLQRGFFDPAGQVVARSELIALPGPQRFQRVDGDHQRDVVENLGENAAEMGVPGVAVDDLGVATFQTADALTDEGQTGAQGLERRDEGLRATGEMSGVHLDAAHVQLAFIKSLVVEAAHLDRGQLGQFARQIFDVDPRATVDMG
ncbi:MAG: hypothetical protein H6R23_1699, partial [Proteobacteria bacterium]|nr:hypothetical protein [Pseudomonadota bacterium]